MTDNEFLDYLREKARDKDHVCVSPEEYYRYIHIVPLQWRFVNRKISEMGYRNLELFGVPQKNRNAFSIPLIMGFDYDKKLKEKNS